MDTALHSHIFSLEQFQRPSRWITRERPKIDRIACPWLVLRFIDPQAEFLYLPTAQVLPEAERLGAAPQSAGLLALSLGLSRLHEDDDHAMLARGLPMYDALYAWCKWSQGESHGWNPAAMRAVQ